jgi:hypothetical protein
VPIERLGDLPILRVVLPHEPLVLPLPLGAVAEEQNGRLVAGRADGGAGRWAKRTRSDTRSRDTV